MNSSGSEAPSLASWETGDFHAEHRGEPFALEPLRQEVEGLGRVSSCVAVPHGPRHEAVDEDAACSDRGRLVEEEAIGLLDLLLEHLPRREDDLEPALALERGQVPAEERRIANELVGGDLEEHDDPGLVELGRAPVDELHAQGRLPRPGGALDQHDAAAQETAGQDVIQPRDAGLDEVPFRHGQRRLPKSRRPCAGKATVARVAVLRLSLLQQPLQRVPSIRRRTHSPERCEPFLGRVDFEDIHPSGGPLVERPPQEAGLREGGRAPAQPARARSRRRRRAAHC